MTKTNISTIGGASFPRRKYNGKCIAAFNGPSKCNMFNVI
jgi:hypothetical protein